MSNDDIVGKASDHVYRLFREKLPEWGIYHNYDHALETVEAAGEIGQESRLNKAEMEIVALAAWFHDTGYAAATERQEEKSAEIATQFLNESGYPPEKTAQVAACIRATKESATPANHMEEVLIDADRIHLGKRRYFKKAGFLRTEEEQRRGKTFTEIEWLKKTIDYISKNNFWTKYAQREYSRQRTKNLIEVQERLRDATDQHEQKEKKLIGKQDKDKIPVRGIETMLRLANGNHIHFSSIADHKASILISTNSLMITFIITLTGRGLLTGDKSASTIPGFMLIPIFILMVSALATIIFAIISTRPKITSGRFTREDVAKKRVNLLFFGSFFNMPVEDYEQGMREMMKDGDYLYGTMIRDIHALGQVLGRKFLYLRISYNVFMFGLIATLVSFIVMYLLSSPDIPPSPAPNG